LVRGLVTNTATAVHNKLIPDEFWLLTDIKHFASLNELAEFMSGPIESFQ